MLKVLIVGSGGREHAIALAVARSSLANSMFFTPGNPGMSELGKCFPETLVTDLSGILAVCKSEKIDLCIIGPEQPLVAGLTDLLEAQGVLVFGPSAKAAALEGSKAFSKAIMKKYGIPTADYQEFNDYNQALDYLNKHPAPIVIKASGLAAGKGAIVCMTDAEAKSALDSMLGSDPVFGDAGKTIVIEEFMEGEEASIFAVCDGSDYVLLPSAQDHKRAFDNDEGPNTGGMGAYSPAPVVTPEIITAVRSQIVEPTLNGMIKEGAPYRGVLYVGLMIQNGKARVVEYNCRLGDPEAQIVLPLFDGDALELFYKAARGELKDIAVSTSSGSAIIVVYASGGYPGPYQNGLLIHGIQEAQELDVKVIHAGTAVSAHGLVTSGGRVLGIVAKGLDLPEAHKKAYEAIQKISFEGGFYRTDIAKRGLQRCIK